MLLFWAPKIAVNRKIFSYFYFINKYKKQILNALSTFRHRSRLRENIKEAKPPRTREPRFAGSEWLLRPTPS